MIRHKFLILFFALTGFLPIFAQKTYRFPLTITYDMYLNFTPAFRVRGKPLVIPTNIPGITVTQMNPTRK